MTQIFIAGDSTAAQKIPEKRPETGWGEKLGDFFTSEITIKNHAQNGRSTKSFLAEGRLKTIEKEIQTGDYLLIQFGHNDQKEDPTRGTNPFDTYQKNLQLFADVTRKKRATPIFLTSITRRMYLPNGTLDPLTLGDYPEAMKQLALEQRILLLDLFTKSQESLRQKKQDETKKLYLHGTPGEFSTYPEGVQDNTHLNEAGAEWIAQLVVDELQKTDCPLKESLKRRSHVYI
ncbi:MULTISPECIES: rhamnogalacturonan acetylesterase [Enterococcus]|uniref:rhamnogalacturonan acetylesterase n=1 Tax=Enterococcus TaxID=1350 RepID=UPI0010F44890|nr:MULTISPECIES: rhamnogalacturonan acetylesterase [Enterococcus]KAF1300578.1 rhamnogalacturonan acetylesterase [Enterococcus sp. JM9B]